MPVSAEYLDYVTDQLCCIGEVVAKKMFGGVGLYHDGLFFGLIASDVLYFKVDDETRQDYHTAGARPFQPYGEESFSMSYYEVPVDVFEDVDRLRKWGSRRSGSKSLVPQKEEKKFVVRPLGVA